MSSIIRSLMVKVGADLTDFDKSLKRVSKELKKTGKDISSAGESLTKGLTMPVLGAAAGIAGMAVAAGKGADELITLSNKTGITTQALQEMEYAARFIDVEVETMTSSMIKLTKNMDMARRGSKEQAKAFAKLGVEYKNNDGTLRNAKAVWADAIDALGSMSNEADRDAIALSLFGRSAAELNPLIKAGSVELNRLGKEAHAVGAVMSDENVKALGAFDDEMQKLEAVFKTAGAEIGAAFLPLLEHVTPFINEKVVPAVKDFAKYVSDLIKRFTELSPSMQTLTVGFIGLAAGIGPVTSVIGKITTGIGGLVGNIGKAVKAIKGGGGFIGALSGILGPAGLVITAIGLVVAGFIAYNAWAKNNKSETDKLVESIKKQDQAWKDLSEQTEENVKANVKDIDYTRELYTELQTLIDANGKLITKNKERVKFILGELNEALDTELTLTGDQIQGYKDAADAIDKLIEKKRAQIILESYEDKYKTAIMEGYEQERRAAELSIQIKDKEIERESTLARMEEARLKHAKEGKRYGAELLQYQIQVDEIERELSNLNESYEEHAKVVQDTRDTINAYEKMSAAILSENYDEIRTLNADVSASFKRTSDESSDALWQQVRIAGEAYAKLQAEVDAGGDEVVKRQAADALEAYNNAVKDYERIGGAIPDAMRLGVKDGEPALKTTIEEFRELIYDTASENIYNKFFGIGTSAGEGFISGLDLKKGPIKEKAKSVFGIDTTVSNYFKMYSPSKVMADIGLNAVKGFIAGMENGRKLLKRTVLSINDMVIDDVMSDMATNLTASAHVDVTAQPHDVSIANTIYSGIKSLISGFKSGQSAPVTVVLEVDGTELGRIALPGVIKESKRLNLKLAEV